MTENQTQTIDQKSPEERLKELKTKQAELAEFSQSDPELNKEIKTLEEQGKEILEGVESQIMDDPEANISFHENLVAALNKGLIKKDENIAKFKTKADELTIQLYEEENKILDKSKMTPEETLNLSLLRNGIKDNKSHEESEKAKKAADEKLIETYKNTIAEQKAKKKAA